MFSQPLSLSNLCLRQKMVIVAEPHKRYDAERECREVHYHVVVKLDFQFVWLCCIFALRAQRRPEQDCDQLGQRAFFLARQFNGCACAANHGTSFKQPDSAPREC